ncbi:MAG: glycosyltransferase family 4 protein [Caldilineaceae bacterium]
MKLLFLSNLYPPQALGGYEQLCQEVAEGLAGRGHQVTILTTDYKRSSGEPAASQINGVTVLRTLHLEAPTDFYRPADFFLRRAQQEATDQRELRQVIERVQPDVLMVWGMWNLSRTLPKLAETLLPERVVYYLCSYWPTDADPHNAYWKLEANRTISKLIKWPLKTFALQRLRQEGYPPQLAMRQSACVSRYVRDQLVQAGKLPTSARVISNGIDPQPFLAHSRTQCQNPLRLLYFGRLIADKGVHTAIEAITHLKQRHLAQSIHLTILGGGHPTYESQLHHMVDEQGLSQHIEFLPSVPREEVPAWLGKFDVFLFTSIWAEPMARSVMEAMATGLLVIGSEVGGQKEMFVNGQNALTFAAGNASQLADQITWAIDHPSEIKQIAVAGKQLVLEHYTLTQMLTTMERYLQEICK